MPSRGRSLASQCSLIYTTETKTLWETRTSFMLATVPGLMGAPQRLSSWWLPRHGLSSLPLFVLRLMGLCGRRLGVLKPIFLCDKCPTLGGMVVLGAPKVLTELQRGIQRDFGKCGHSMVRRHTSLRSLSLRDCVSNWQRDVSRSRFRKSCSELRCT